MISWHFVQREGALVVRTSPLQTLSINHYLKAAEIVTVLTYLQCLSLDITFLLMMRCVLFLSGGRGAL